MQLSIDLSVLVFVSKFIRLFIFLSVSLVSINFSSSPFNFFFGPPEETGEKNIRDYFIRYLGRAKKSFDGAFFEVRDDKIVKAFLSAHKRGVKIRLIVDDNYYFKMIDHETMQMDMNDFNPFVKALLNAGIEVKHDNGRSALMHNKFAIVDKQWVWAGSYNITSSCTEKNENDALEVKNENLAEIYTREFEEMFIDGQFGITSPSTPELQSTEIKDTKIEVLFAPEDNPLARIEELLRNAEQEVYFTQFAMTAVELGDALVERAKAGVKVQGIFDKLLYRSTGPYAEFSKLTKNGIPVVVYDSPHRGKLHHKTFIIDPNGKNPVLITGSMNASANGNKTNDENVIIIHNAFAAQTYLKRFRSLFGKTSNVMAYFRSLDKIKAEQKIDRASLFINSNGTNVQSVTIQFPARWPKEQPDANIRIYRRRDGKLIDTTDQEAFNLTETNIWIGSANLKKDGEDSELMVRFSNLIAPKIPGYYNLYIKVKYYNNSDFMPLKTQPVVEIINCDGTALPNYEPGDEIIEQLSENDLTGLRDLLELKASGENPELLQNSAFLRKTLRILQNNNRSQESGELLEALRKLD
jgi:phosphatidylserine/phosphatidylglycerophosphate/cardiolipin synthase-like enzyme